ncbi:hypothetical protein ACI2KR_07925 [Pseudomonas luteola]
MSDYSVIPPSPRQLAEESQEKGVFHTVMDTVDEVNEQDKNRTTGYVLDNRVLEDRAFENLKTFTQNPATAVVSVGAGYIKGEVCSPEQLKEIQHESRYDGIPILQLVQTGIEKATGFVTGNENFKFGETTTSLVERADTLGKAALTGGSSLLADSMVNAGRDGLDSIHCMTDETKPGDENEYGRIPKTPAVSAGIEMPDIESEMELLPRQRPSYEMDGPSI